MEKKTFKERRITNDLSKSKTTSYKSDFTQEELDKCWNNYHNIKLQNKEFNIASLLKIQTKKVRKKYLYRVSSDITKKNWKLNFQNY